MDEKPKRSWFRFRLSTVLILTAIAAWGMATRPWSGPIIFSTPHPVLTKFTNLMLAGCPGMVLPIAVPVVERPDPIGPYGINRKLAGPALALATFLAWKAVWAIRSRIALRRDPQPGPSPMVDA